MKKAMITLRSITYAQRGQRELEKAGIPAVLSRTPKKYAEMGCGYCLLVSPDQREQAQEVLLRRGVGYIRSYRPEEIRL